MDIITEVEQHITDTIDYYYKVLNHPQYYQLSRTPKSDEGNVQKFNLIKEIYGVSDNEINEFINLDTPCVVPQQYGIIVFPKCWSMQKELNSTQVIELGNAIKEFCEKKGLSLEYTLELEYDYCEYQDTDDVEGHDYTYQEITVYTKIYEQENMIEFTHRRLNQYVEKLQRDLKYTYDRAVKIDGKIKEVVMYWKHAVHKVNENV